MRTVSHIASFELSVPIDRLFPLFSPEGERLWLPGWDYENVMGTTELAEDYVFLTKSHDHATADAVWIAKRYEPENHFVQFYKIEPGEKIGVISVRCEALETDRTSVEVNYEYRALSDSAKKFVAEFDEAAYTEFIAEWETLLTRYFADQA